MSAALYSVTQQMASETLFDETLPSKKHRDYIQVTVQQASIYIVTGERVSALCTSKTNKPFRNCMLHQSRCKY